MKHICRKGSILKRVARGALVTVSMVTVACGAKAARASQEEIIKFYEGRNINVIVGFNPGGGYDVYARLLARHLSKHIPGNPTALVQNMPGAGSLKGVKFLDTTAPKDGTTISTFNPGLIAQSIVAPSKLNVNFQDYAWLGSISEDVRVCFTWHTRNARKWNDLLGQEELSFGGTSPGTLGYIEARIVKEYLNVPLRLIIGYPGSAEKRIAIESGELEGDCGGWVNVPEEWIKGQKINLMVRFSPTLIQGLDKSTPYVGDLIEGDLRLNAFKLLMASEEIGRPFLTSSAVPKLRIHALRAAFDASMKDPAFLADAAKQRLTVSPMTAEQVEARLAKIYASAPDVIIEAKRISGED